MKLAVNGVPQFDKEVVVKSTIGLPVTVTKFVFVIDSLHPLLFVTNKDTLKFPWRRY